MKNSVIFFYWYHDILRLKLIKSLWKLKFQFIHSCVLRCSISFLYAPMISFLIFLPRLLVEIYLYIHGALDIIMHCCYETKYIYFSQWAQGWSLKHFLKCRTQLCVSRRAEVDEAVQIYIFLRKHRSLWLYSFSTTLGILFSKESLFLFNLYSSL